MEMAICIAQKLHHDQEQPMKQSNSSTKAKNKLLCLEDYLAFLRSRHPQSLTCDQLKQIMTIHGLKRLRSRVDNQLSLSLSLSLSLILTNEFVTESSGGRSGHDQANRSDAFNSE
uniref:DUF7787 domain-containing protein n=1 Tax=Opuntia streptacantha TaxID=393608 RepID=A0A7C9CQL3_OPUST